MTDKTPNYTVAQEAIIVAAIEANGGVANLEIATAVAGNRLMDGENGVRKPRSIVAKMRRIVDTREDFSYETKARVTKTGKAIEKKDGLVEAIAASVGVTVASLEGLANAPKAALETLRDAIAA